MSLEIMNVEDATHVGATALRSTADVNPSHDHSVVKIMLAIEITRDFDHSVVAPYTLGRSQVRMTPTMR